MLAELGISKRVWGAGCVGGVGGVGGVGRMGENAFVLE